MNTVGFMLIRDLFMATMEFLFHPCQTEFLIKWREQKWVEQGRTLGATHVVIRWDSTEMESIPYFVMPQESVTTVCDHIRSAGAFSVEAILAVG